VTASHPCGWIVVRVKVIHPVKGKTFSASATADFSPGADVTFPLRRSGKSFAAIAKVQVPAGQATNVPVRITVIYGGVPQPEIIRIAKITAP
jgi:hypothetical protein